MFTQVVTVSVQGVTPREDNSDVVTPTAHDANASMAASAGTDTDEAAALSIDTDIASESQDVNVETAPWQTIAFLQSPLQATSDPAWRAKVEELAGRGVTLGAILDFYRELWKNMPHFDPDRSTTRDVVRCSVIPLTAMGGERPRGRFFDLGGRSPVAHQIYSMINMMPSPSGSGAAVPSAYATQANHGKALLPGVMVTHHWANLFSHTVAAIVADALEESFYEQIVKRLSTAEQTQRLIEELHTQGVLEEAYWLCALSVNQHCSICGSFGSQPEMDTVLCSTYPLCNCSTAKFVSGAPSEMNKFGDMMIYTKNEKADFRQVVVVDKSFGIFGRAWCVAELVEASNLGMTQHLKIFDSESLEAHRSDLKSLDISKCEASVPEDKDYILSKVLDVHAFNLHLREMLLHEEQGLIAQWTNKAQAMVKSATLVVSAWDELSPSYTASLESAATRDFRKYAILVATLPLLACIGLFALSPLENVDSGWENNTTFLFLLLPAYTLAASPFFSRFCTALILKVDWPQQVIVRELVWSCAFAMVFTASIAGAAIGFDVFPVPLGGYVGAFSGGCLLLPWLWMVFPREYRNEDGFWRKFFVSIFILLVLYAVFGFAYPMLNAWYLAAKVEGQALIVLVFLSTRILFELIGVFASKQLGADILPLLVFYSVTAYEWQMGIMLARATHWLISAELMVINLLENAYFLSYLPKRRDGDGSDVQKSMRILVVLLARELAEVLASVQFLVILLCIYSSNPHANEVTRGMSAQVFAQKATFVGFDAGLETLSLFVTCAVLVAKGWAPVPVLRGFIALHGDVLVKCQLLSSLWYMCIQFVYFGNDLTFKFEWLK